MMSMVDLLNIGVKTLRIDIEYSIEMGRERVHSIYEFLNCIIHHFQSSPFISQLFMCSFYLRHLIHLEDG